MLALLVMASLSEGAAAQETGGQSRPFLQYARAGVGVTSMEAPREEFPIQPVLERSFSLGFSLGARQVLELSVGFLRSETTEDWPDDPEVILGEAPYTVSLRAIPVEATIQRRFSSLRVGGVEPVAGLGMSWTAVKDTWQSDTPAESSRSSVFGGTAVAGIQTTVFDRVSAVIQGQYRTAVYSKERFVQAIELGGFSVRTGLQVSFE